MEKDRFVLSDYSNFPLLSTDGKNNGGGYLSRREVERTSERKRRKRRRPMENRAASVRERISGSVGGAWQWEQRWTC